MDRDRLKNIQTADLSEGNTNEEFVLWLKTKGPSYVIIIMVVIVSYLFYVRYQEGKTQYRAEAWKFFLEAKVSGLPASYEDIALTYADVDSIASLGLLQAADAYLKSVVTNQSIGSDANITTSLTLEDRTFYLEKADNLYLRVIENDTRGDASTLFIISGFNGRAAVAEANGDIDAARGYYESIIERSGVQYPALADQAQKRIETLAPLTDSLILLTDNEIEAWSNQSQQRDPITPNPTIDTLTAPLDFGNP